jgi:hypothetical protein
MIENVIDQAGPLSDHANPASIISAAGTKNSSKLMP